MGEVDEEGYSIRPQDAAAIRGFPDDNPQQDSDDSDFEDGEKNGRVRPNIDSLINVEFGKAFCSFLYEYLSLSLSLSFPRFPE